VQNDVIQIRCLEAGHEHYFDRIAEEVFDYAIDQNRLARYLATPGHLIVVALAGGEMIGQVAAVVHEHADLRPTELYIDEVGVTPAFQRQGVASRMLDTMFTLGKNLGCGEAWLGTEPDNEAAKQLYASRGAPAEPVSMYVFKL